MIENIHIGKSKQTEKWAPSTSKIWRSGESKRSLRASFCFCGDGPRRNDAKRVDYIGFNFIKKALKIQIILGFHKPEWVCLGLPGTACRPLSVFSLCLQNFFNTQEIWLFCPRMIAICSRKFEISKLTSGILPWSNIAACCLQIPNKMWLDTFLVLMRYGIRSLACDFRHGQRRETFMNCVPSTSKWPSPRNSSEKTPLSIVHFEREQIFARDGAEMQSRALVAAHGHHEPQARRENGLVNSMSDEGRYEQMHSREYSKWIPRPGHGTPLDQASEAAGPCEEWS